MLLMVSALQQPKLCDLSSLLNVIIVYAVGNICSYTPLCTVVAEIFKYIFDADIRMHFSLTLTYRTPDRALHISHTINDRIP